MNTLKLEQNFDTEISHLLRSLFIKVFPKEKESAQETDSFSNLELSQVEKKIRRYIRSCTEIDILNKIDAFLDNIFSSYFNHETEYRLIVLRRYAEARKQKLKKISAIGEINPFSSALYDIKKWLRRYEPSVVYLEPSDLDEADDLAASAFELEEEYRLNQFELREEDNLNAFLSEEEREKHAALKDEEREELMASQFELEAENALNRFRTREETGYLLSLEEDPIPESDPIPDEDY